MGMEGAARAPAGRSGEVESVEITVSEEGDTIRIVVSGKDATPESLETFRSVCESSVTDRQLPHVVLDFEGLHYLGSEGVGILANAHRRLAEQGRRLTVRNPTTVVSRVLQVTHLDRYLHIETEEPGS